MIKHENLRRKSGIWDGQITINIGTKLSSQNSQ